MRPSIRSPWTISLLLSALMGAFLVAPAIAAPDDHRYFGSRPGATADVSAADHAAQLGIAAALVRKPDARIRYASHGYPGSQRSTNLPFVGNNVYNATAARQGATVENFNEIEGAYYIFEISIQNDGSHADRFRVKATGSASAGWTIRYYRGATDVTAAILAGTYQTTSLAPGATYLIRARITVKTGTSVTRLLTIRSGADPTKVDAVRFAYKAIACGC
jgi:hypothetical protein